MSTVFTLVPALFILIFLTGRGTGFAQTVATGHITAEVIESISASSQAVTNLALDTSAANSIQSQMVQGQSYASATSGALTLFSGNTFTVNVVLKSEAASDSEQNDCSIESLSRETGLVLNSVSKSEQPVTINETPNISDSLVPPHPRGNYTVVFACN